MQICNDYLEAELVMHLNDATPCEAAIYYAKTFEWKVLPIYEITDEGFCTCLEGTHCTSPGQHSMTENGVEDATADLDQIREWWSKKPNANIGIATGQMSRLIVLTIDLKADGLESFDAFGNATNDVFQIPKDAFFCLTGDGVLQVYFRKVEGLMLRTKNFGPGLDFWGDGSYIIAPPSISCEGEMHSWTDDYSQ